MNVKPKKHFGQHFLKDQSICEKIAKSIVLKEDKLKQSKKIDIDYLKSGVYFVKFSNQIRKIIIK